MLSRANEPLVDFGHQDNLPAHTVIITCRLSLAVLLDCDDEYKLTEMGVFSAQYVHAGGSLARSMLAVR
jgi:hypothetical protein